MIDLVSFISQYKQCLIILYSCIELHVMGETKVLQHTMISLGYI